MPVNYGGSKMTIICTLQLRVRNDVKLSTPYGPHNVLNPTTTILQSCQAVWTNLKKTFDVFITLTIGEIDEIGDNRSVPCCIVGIHRLVECIFSAALCTGNKVGDAGSITSRVVRIYSPAFTRFSVSNAHGLMYEAVLWADFVFMQDNATPGPGPNDVIIQLSCLLDWQVR